MATKRFCDKCGREMGSTTGFLFNVDVNTTTTVRMAVRTDVSGDICPRCISDAVLLFVDLNYPPLTRKAPSLPPAKARRRGPLSS